MRDAGPVEPRPVPQPHRTAPHRRRDRTGDVTARAEAGFLQTERVRATAGRTPDPVTPWASWASWASCLDVVVPAHYDGWTHFTEGLADLELAFHEAGLSSLLRTAPHGSWVSLRP